MGGVYTRTWRQMLGRARPGSRIGRVAHLILHHELGRPLPATATIAQEVQRLKAIDAYHRSLGWDGFGYSAMPCASGRGYEGRGYKRSGAHTGHMNRRALAALLPGTDTGMTARQVAWLKAWQAEGVRQGAIVPDAQWSGHRDHMARDCPGDRNYSQIGRLNAPDDEEFTVKPEDEETIRRIVREEVEARAGRAVMLHRMPDNGKGDGFDGATTQTVLRANAADVRASNLRHRDVERDFRTIREGVRDLLKRAGAKTRHDPPDVHGV